MGDGPLPRPLSQNSGRGEEEGMGCGDVEGDCPVAFTGVFGFGGVVEVWWGRGVPPG